MKPVKTEFSGLNSHRACQTVIPAREERAASIFDLREAENPPS